MLSYGREFDPWKSGWISEWEETIVKTRLSCLNTGWEEKPEAKAEKIKIKHLSCSLVLGKWGQKGKERSKKLICAQIWETLCKTKEELLSTRSIRSQVYSVSLFVPYLFCATSWDKCTGHSKVSSFHRRGQEGL